jgi:hypothetical protein
MSQTTPSTVAARLARNLEYKITYLEIYQEYLKQVSDPDVIEFLQQLMDDQQNSIAGLSSRLRRLGHPVNQAASLEKLKAQAFTRRDTLGRLQFVQTGLERSAAWYAEQLLDREMAGDPATRHLLIDLGQTEAAALWWANTLLAGMAAGGAYPSQKLEPPPAARRRPRGPGGHRTGRRGDRRPR